MLEPGDPFPAFALPDQNGAERRLADLGEGRPLILFVYPQDDTPACTMEALDFKAQLPSFEGLGYRVAGISKDDTKSHCAYAAKFGLPFPLLTDADGALLETIGAWGEKALYGKKVIGTIRSTFVIAPDGRLLRAFRNVKATGHVARLVRELGAGA